ncbi:uncharacterized protein LOC133990801 [Scomber scombrus]|uniref:uncharacterized protein LOC133990801 n=1 Tax=Scomber scombrus TaxID=13677 RepID=UPI002DD9FEA5|nr:uncharacterized protein LOC133990801 [Scomber scombrus]
MCDRRGSTRPGGDGYLIQHRALTQASFCWQQLSTEGVGGFLSSDCQQASKQANCNLAAVRRLLAEQLAVSLATPALAVLPAENCDCQKEDKQIMSSDSSYYNADRSTAQELQNLDILKGTDITSQTAPSWPCCHPADKRCEQDLGDAAAGLLNATSLMKVKNHGGNPLSIDSIQAHDFLTNSRPKRNIDPKWHRGTPDFQSYYRFYNSIGHIEGLYEIDRIRMLYQQMRHLEVTYGPDASSYQSLLGVQTTTAAPTTTTVPPPPPTTPAPTPDPLEHAQRIYLCNPKDPLCKPQIVYLPTGAVPVLCDPRHNPACRPKTEEEIKAAAPPPSPAPPAPKKTVPPPPPPAATAKGMEYDCDPYWDPDCLIDHPPHPIQETSAPDAPAEEKVVKEEVAKAVESVATAAIEKPLNPYFDPYDFKRDLFDPLSYADPAPEQE